jgi:hypothetical protein
VNIGEQRRTIYVEPIEEPPDDPIREPARKDEPIPEEPVLVPEPRHFRLIQGGRTFPGSSN